MRETEKGEESKGEVPKRRGKEKVVIRGKKKENRRGKKKNKKYKTTVETMYNKEI